MQRSICISEGKLKQNIVLEGEVLQDKNQEFSAIKHFHLQKGNLSELKFSKEQAKFDRTITWKVW